MVPSECATTVCAGPKRAATASSALPISTPWVRPGPAGPGSEDPWEGASNSTVRKPAAVSGATNPASWLPRPAQPCTR